MAAAFRRPATSAANERPPECLRLQVGEKALQKNHQVDRKTTDQDRQGQARRAGAPVGRGTFGAFPLADKASNCSCWWEAEALRQRRCGFLVGPWLVEYLELGGIRDTVIESGLALDLALDWKS